MPSEILPGLWQGGFPEPGTTRGFDTVVFCAKELLPGRNIPVMPSDYAPSEVLLAPNDDSGIPPTRAEIALAAAASKAVADRVEAGKRVLVTCAQGRNRSGFVSAIAARRLLGCSGEKAARLVQSRRPNALTNPYFVAALSTLLAEAPTGHIGFPTYYRWWLALGRPAGLPYRPARPARPKPGEPGYVRAWDPNRPPDRAPPPGFKWVFGRGCTEPGGGIIPAWGLAPIGT